MGRSGTVARRTSHRWRATVIGVATVALTLGLLSTAAVPAAQGSATRSAPPVPTGLVTNFRGDPIDVDLARDLEFSWQLPDGQQNAYQLRMDRVTRERGESRGVLWRTSKIDSANSTAVRYDGPQLEAGERYSWSVRVWSERGRPSAWSEPAEFGIAPAGDWGDSVPIWPGRNDGDAWSDYRLDTRIQVTSNAFGVRFRSPREDLGYMWQFRASDAGNPNTLVPHTRDGGWTSLEPVPLGTVLETGTWHDVRIDVVGSTITTYFDGVVIDERTLELSAAGGIGFRTGNSESGLADDVRVTSLVPGSAGEVLYENDFSPDASTFPCGSVEDGALVIGRATDCLSSNTSNDWALMRDEIELAEGKEVLWASAFATGSSFDGSEQFVYKLYVDGEFVGLGPTKSWDDEVRYDGFDVTELVASDRRHALSVVAHTSEDQRFQAYLKVRYTDGSTQTFGTGPGWTAMSGADIWTSTESIGTSYYAAPQEDMIMGEYPDGFMHAGYDDAAWSAPEVREPFEDLVPTPFGKIEQQRHAPVRIVDKGDGDYFVDFGRTWIGGVDLRLDGTAGHRVSLRFGEELTGPDTVRYDMRTGNTYEDVITLRDGEQTITTWGMRVFRYIDIVDSPVPITEDNLRALAQVYPFDDGAAQLTSSNEDLVSVWQLSKNTIESLNHNFYIDSWTRERRNYEADAYLQQNANAFLTADPTLGMYSMDYFQDNRTWPVEWPMYVISAAYDTWQRTGSTDQLERTYDSLVDKLLDEAYDESTGTIHEYDAIVDWPTGQRDGFVFAEQNTILNALSYRNYANLAEIARVLGHDDDATRFAERAGILRASLNERFFDPDAGAYDDGLDAAGVPTGHHSVHASVFPSAFGVPATDERRDVVADFIAERGMACSVYCSGFLLKSLYDAGYGRDALDLLTSRDTSGWLNMIENGAGATSEAWDTSQKPNMTWSHPWAAAPAYVIPRDMYGIRPTTPGYSTFTVRPQPGGQEHGSITVPTIKGNIGASFRVTEGRTDVGVDVPGNTVATVSVPVPDEHTGQTLYIDGQPRAAELDDGWLTTEVQPGCHTVSTVGTNDDAGLHSMCR